MRLLSLLLLTLASACASIENPSIASQLPGSWLQEITVFGESRRSIITFNSDGTFNEATGRRSSTGIESFPLLFGRWHVQGEIVTLEYAGGFTGSGKPETEKRHVLQITSSKLVSRDSQFGIVVERDRYTVQERQ